MTRCHMITVATIAAAHAANRIITVLMGSTLLAPEGSPLREFVSENRRPAGLTLGKDLGS